MTSLDDLMDDDASTYSRPSVTVAVLFRDGEHGPVLPQAGGAPVDLQDLSAAADVGVIERLRASLLRLEAVEDVPARLVLALRDTGVPPLFRSCVWLQQARPLVLPSSGIAEIAGVRVSYRPRIGLIVDGDETG